MNLLWPVPSLITSLYIFIMTTDPSILSLNFFLRAIFIQN